MPTNTKRSKLKALFFPNQSEIQQIREKAGDYAAQSNESLIEIYNGRAQVGIFGSRAQWVDTVALALALKQRFGDPVVHFVEGVLYCPCIVEIADDGALLKTEFADWG